MREKDPDKINRIYNATLKLVNEEGLDAINMSKIAKEAQMASGTLYIYFENKEVLLNELYNYASNLWISEVDLSMESNELRINLQKIWNNTIFFAFDNYELMEFKRLFLYSRYMNKNNIEKSGEILNVFYQVFDTAIKNDEIKNINSKLMYSIAESSMFQVIKYLKEIGVYNQDIIDDSFLMCWHGLRK